MNSTVWKSSSTNQINNRQKSLMIWTNNNLSPTHWLTKMHHSIPKLELLKMKSKDWLKWLASTQTSTFIIISGKIPKLYKVRNQKTQWENFKFNYQTTKANYQFWLFKKNKKKQKSSNYSDRSNIIKAYYNLFTMICSW